MIFTLGRALRATGAARRHSAAAYPPSGPIWSALSGKDVPSEAQFRDAGAAVCDWLGTSVEKAEADATLATRVFGLYLPIFYWCRGLLEARRAAGDGKPLCVFVSAPQGCGKTTLCDAVAHLFAREDAVVADVSYDDFYLTRAEQEQVAARGNELTKYRGHAGTHDLALGEATIKGLMAAAGPVELPRYDKKAFGGLGDRGRGKVVEPPDVALVEGWCAGFRRTGEAGEVHPGLGDVDAALPAYARWESLADAWLVLGLDDTDTVYQWRLEAERRAGGGLSDDGVRDFVARFLPAYEAYCPGLYAAAPAGLDGKPTLCFKMDAKREPVPGTATRAP